MEEEILATCRELGVGFVAYSPLGRGFLTGRFQSSSDLEDGDFRKNHPRFQGENLQRNLKLVDGIKKLAEEKGCTAAQLALAWVLAQGETIVPIVGTKRRSYLNENLAALEVSLTPADLARASIRWRTHGKTATWSALRSGRDAARGLLTESDSC